jgi:peptidoglycan/LPS O-acetylase OafA/YrhL
MIKILKLDVDPNRIFGLDVLRALAIIFVLIEHGSFLLKRSYREILDLFVFDGVTIFFVLSGFLIGGILIKQIDLGSFGFSELRRFWVRRWLRTLPTYFLVLSVLCLIHQRLDGDFSISGVRSYFIFFQNFFEPHPNFFPEAWSLSVEEWFYIAFPTTLWLGLRFKLPKHILLLFLVFSGILLVPAFRFQRFMKITPDQFNDWDLFFRKQVVTRIDSLLFGVLGAYFNYYYNSYWKSSKRLMLILGLVMFFSGKFVLPRMTDESGIYAHVFSFSLTSLATLCLLPYLSGLRKNDGVIFKTVTVMSLISYSMYLLNFSIIQMLIVRNVPWKLLTNIPEIIMGSAYFLYWILVFALSFFVYKYFESPVTALREKMEGSAPEPGL